MPACAEVGTAVRVRGRSPTDFWLHGFNILQSRTRNHLRPRLEPARRAADPFAGAACILVVGRTLTVGCIPVVPHNLVAPRILAPPRIPVVPRNLVAVQPRDGKE